MRPSKRTEILEAALRLADREGITAVTLDSVAAEAGMTKGGLVYHFRSREALLAGILQHMNEHWEQLLTEALGGAAEDAILEEKVATYAQVATESATSGQLAFILEFARRPPETSAWLSIAEKWTPTPEAAEQDPRSFDAFVARLTADGLWLYESISGAPLSAHLRQQIAKRIADNLHKPPEGDPEL